VHALCTKIILLSPFCRSKGATVLEQLIIKSQRRMGSGKLILPMLRSHNNRLKNSITGAICSPHPSRQ
jgi:hypothetical protein